MINLIQYLQILEEIEQDKQDLRKLNLTEEEIEGYIEFCAENFFGVEKGVDN